VNDPRLRHVEWAAHSLTQGDVLDAFSAYCEGVDELERIERSPTLLEIVWRGRERSLVEIADMVTERAEPTLLLGELSDDLVVRLLDDGHLRTRLAVYDLPRLEKVNAVRSSAFVYFEWFLRDEYGVKVIPAAAFTRGLVERGIISLGFG
jgi:hypothetical protein